MEVLLLPVLRSEMADLALEELVGEAMIATHATFLGFHLMFHVTDQTERQ